ncbi:prolyl aminopeptidase [Mycoplasmopsis hyopharyngis]|uniref:prolyl aminopeptidase n=1 Tax=Mycoplasmopsis hyopharyngis TaxID=29558 RepID=UPI003872F9E4
MKLYDLVEPFNSGHLKVSEIHQIYFEEVGNPNGIPILYVHGGPGGSISESSRQFFDPQVYRVILFDQRGCGKSTPSAEIKENNTWELIKDIEKIRVHLNIDKWILFGGSWGSALSLIYAINYPKRVLGMILRGIYLARKEDNDYLYQNGACNYFPELYQEFRDFVPKNEQNNLVKAYNKLLNHKDLNIAYDAAYHWAKWELNLITLNPIPEMQEYLKDAKANLEIARLENHFFINNNFLEDDNYILNNSNKIKDIPTIIIHGRYDMDCRPVCAFLLAKQLNKCDLNFINASGHSAKEINIAEALVDATEKFKKIIGEK